MSKDNQLNNEELKNVTGGVYGIDDVKTLEELYMNKKIFYQNSYWKITKINYTDYGDNTWSTDYSLTLQSETDGTVITMTDAEFDNYKNTLTD